MSANSDWEFEDENKLLDSNSDWEFETQQQEKPQKKERSTIEKGGRIAGQFALGAAQAAAFPYDVAVAPLATKSFHTNANLQRIGEDLEWLYESNIGKPVEEWSQQHKDLHKHLTDLINNPQKVEEQAEPVDISVRGLAEKVTGKDLHPEGILEKAANWIGFLKDPKKLKEIVNIGLKPKELIKSLTPGTEEIRGLTAGTALQMAEEGHFGPVGTLAAAVAGDLAGFGPGIAKGIVKNPKEFLAKTTNFLTRANSKNAWTKQFIEDARESGLKLDAGSLTNSNLVKMAQARAAQSGLSGEAFDNFRKELSGQVMKEYENVLSDLGEQTFENYHQAEDAIKQALKVDEINLNIPKEQSRKSRSLQGRIDLWEKPQYEQNLLNRISPIETSSTLEGGRSLKTVANDIKTPIKEEFNQRWSAFNEEVSKLEAGPQAQLAQDMKNFVDNHRGSLLLGESTAESRVLQAALRLQNQLMTAEGGLVGVALEDLIKTKRTLADVANWEFGGSNFESSYKKLVGDIDSAIQRTLGNVDENLLNNFQQLNSHYSEFKNAFENKNVIKLFEPKNQNYNALYDSFVTNPDKLKSLETILKGSKEGENLLNQIKRDYANNVISKPNASEREIRDLSQVLGSEYADDLIKFSKDREFALKNPKDIAKPQQPLGIEIKTSENGTSKPISKNVKETLQSARMKMYDYLKDKSPDKIMKLMNTPEGIRKLKSLLEQTEDGKELFKQLSRFKLTEMIEKKMQNNITEQVKLGTFSNLLKSAQEKAIARELLGDKNFKKLVLLQKNAGRLAESANKFFNASQSGVTATDVGMVSGAVMGVLSGNPFIAIPALAGIGTMRIISNLFTDTTYLKYLEEAVLSNVNYKTNKFLSLLEKMTPSIQKAIIESQEPNQFEKAQQLQ